MVTAELAPAVTLMGPLPEPILVVPELAANIADELASSYETEA